MKKILASLAGGLSAFVLMVGVMSPSASAASSSAPTIVDTAISINQQSGEFSTLIAALSCTGLVPLLDSEVGLKFTVFAPTDAAFAKANLNADNVCSAFSKRQLRNILLYHVNLGQKDASQVLDRRVLLMSNLQVARINATVPSIAGQKIIAPDAAKTSNGIIHIIDGVMLPPR